MIKLIALISNAFKIVQPWLAMIMEIKKYGLYSKYSLSDARSDQIGRKGIDRVEM